VRRPAQRPVTLSNHDVALVVHPGDLVAQHGVLVPQHQQFGVLTQISPHQHSGQAEHTAHEPIQDRQQHPTIIHAPAPHEERRSGHCIEFPSPTGEELAYALLTATCSQAATTEHTYLAPRYAESEE
jgi:hypothetical protein